MTRARPFLPTVLVALPLERLGDLANWAKQMTEAGADGLVLNGIPEDPIVTGLLTELRRTTALPLELHTPERAEPGTDWPSLLAQVEVDWLAPAQPVSAQFCKALTSQGIRLAWPARMGLPKVEIPRIHARVPEDIYKGWPEEREGIEYSLTLPFSQLPASSYALEVDRLIIPGEALDALDPASQLVEWRLRLSSCQHGTDSKGSPASRGD